MTSNICTFPGPNAANRGFVQMLTLGPGCALEHGGGRHLGSHVLATHLHGGLAGIRGPHVADGIVLPAAAEQGGHEGQICCNLLLPVLKVVQLVHTARGLHAARSVRIVANNLTVLLL